MRRLMLTLGALALASGCTKNGASATPAAEKPVEAAPAPTATAAEPLTLAAKDVKRADATATAAEEQAVSARDLALGAKLLAKTEPGQNAVLSPWSLAQALAMTEAGARGDTAKAFEAVLKEPTPGADWHRARAAIETAVKSRGAGASGKGGGPFRLNVVNHLYGRTDTEFEQPFLSTLATWYGAGLTLLDFIRAAEPSRQHINAEVSKATEKLIPELLPKGLIDHDTVLVLVNAVFFNGGWATPFDKAKSAPAPFHLAGGEAVPVPTMNAEKYPAQAAVVDGVQLLELPYDGGEVSLLVLMPPDGGVADLEAKLAAGWLDGARAQLKERKLELHLPRFKVRSQVQPADALKALGLGIAFDETAADFTGMSPVKPLFIDAVVHEAVVDTDEEGTEAAAATAVVMATRGAMRPFVVRIDRPFLFLIRDGATGAPLFLGRVMDPR